MRSHRPRTRGAGLLASVFVLVSLCAAFMAGVLLSGDIDRTNLIVASVLLGAFLIWAVFTARGLYLALFGARLPERRWTRIGHRLLEMGFREPTPAIVADTLRLSVALLAPNVLDARRGGGIDHVMVGTIGGSEVRSFNVRVRGSGWYDAPAIALRIEASLAPTLIFRFRGPIPPLPGMHRVSFEHEEFNRSIAVFSTDPYFATAMIDARMMEWLRGSLRRTSIELAGEWVDAWSLPRHRVGRGPIELLELLGDLDRRVPRVVPSLFPVPHGLPLEAAS